MMKKNFKRWIALILAFALVAASTMYSTGTSLIATTEEPGTPVEEQVEVVPDETVPDETVPEEGEPATETQEITLPEAPAEEPELQAAQGAKEETTEPTEEEVIPEEVLYFVTIQKPDVEGGVIKTWTDGQPMDISYDGNNQFKQEVTEGTLFRFSVTADETHEIDAVTDQNGNRIEATSMDGKTAIYEVPITEEKAFTVSYKDVVVEESISTYALVENTSNTVERTLQLDSPWGTSADGTTMSLGNTLFVAARQWNWSQSTYDICVSIDSNEVDASTFTPVANHPDWFHFQPTETGIYILQVKYTLDGVTYIEGATITVSNSTVTFNGNGGEGEVPAPESARVSESIILPEYAGTKDGKQFLGWSSRATIDATYAQIYAPGTEYTVNGDITLYAIYQETKATATFFVRLDGKIPYEPSQYGVGAYTRMGIDIPEVLKSNEWVCDTTGAAVLNNLYSTPTDAQIKQALPSYNPAKQYITWYVIKRVQAGGWHVDGVIQDKNSYSVSYDGNSSACGGTTPWGVPLGSQFTAGDTCLVGRNGGNAGTVWTPGVNGYTFIGWNTRADGTGTSYASDSEMVVNGAITLYAQWESNTNTAYKVEFYEVPTGIDDEPNGEAPVLLGTSRRSGTTGATVSVTAADKSRTGYVYMGDDYEGSKLTGTIAADESTTLKVFFRILKPVHIIFKTNDGEATIAEKTGQYNETFQTGSDVDIRLAEAKNILKNGGYLDGVTVKSEDVDKCSSMDEIQKLGFGFAFDGWYTGSQNGGCAVALGENMGNLPIRYHEMTVGGTNHFTTTDETVYAHYKVVYTVAYEPGEHGTFEGQRTDGLSYGSETPAFKGETAGEAGYTFAGWSPTVSDTVNGTVIYTAQWTQNQYSVTYAPGDYGTFETQTFSDLKYGSKTPVFIGETTGEAGYTFKGWNPEVADTVTGTITYTAQWTQNQYSVTYVPGDHGTFASQTFEDLKYGSKTPAFTGETTGEVDYKFTGWNPEVEDIVTGSITYTAQWQEKQKITITAADATKEFDQKPLTATSAAITSGSLLPGHEVVSVTVKGAQTEVGTSANVASDVIIMEGEKDVTGDYAITYVAGTLTVTEAEKTPDEIPAPVEPIDPTEPTEPTNPTEPTESTEPENPTEPDVEDAEVEESADYEVTESEVADSDVTDLTAAIVETTPTVVEPAEGNVTPSVVEPASITETSIVASVTPELVYAEETEAVVRTPEGYDLTSVANSQTPLANTELAEHSCCILHFLLLLFAFIITACYTKSMKKMQARIFERREELEIEMAKRREEEVEENNVA